MALEDWARREDPPHSVWQTVRRWVEGLAVAPWRAPSTPFPELSDPPRYEFRTAQLDEAGGVEVVYKRYYDGEIVDLIWVGRPTGAGPT